MGRKALKMPSPVESVSISSASSTLIKKIKKIGLSYEIVAVFYLGKILKKKSHR